MEYTNFSKEQLLARIRSLERLNQELLREKEQETRLEYAWTGNLGHWYWNVETNEVTFNPLKVTTLGYDQSEIPEHVTYQYFTDKLHPEDHPKAMEAMKNHLYGKADVYEIEYRIQTKGGDYKWYYDRGKVTQRASDGKPVFLAGIVFDITERKEIQKELEHKNRILSQLSMTDGLTQINNHRMLVEHLQVSIAEASRTQDPLSIAIFDIDDFKQINDTKGHIYGDQVLVAVATIIKRSIRGTDLAGRYGGEEFMIVFSATDVVTAAKVADRIRQAVARHPFADGIKVTVSSGVKQYSSGGLTEFINEADQNLYKAKRRGKNQVVAE